MNFAAVLSTLLSIIFVFVVCYIAYLVKVSTDLQRGQQQQINQSLLDGMARAQKNNELSASASKELAQIVMMLHEELQASRDKLGATPGEIAGLAPSATMTTTVTTTTVTTDKTVAPETAPEPDAPPEEAITEE